MGNERVTQRLRLYAVAGTATLEIGSPTQLLATSNGLGGISIDDTDIYWSGQDLVDTKGQLIKRDVAMTVAGLTVIPSTLVLLTGLSSSATATMHNSTGATATAYRISNTLEKQYFRMGFDITDSDVDARMEWYAPRTQLMGSIPFAFDKENWDTQELNFKCFGPASGNGTVIEHLVPN